MKNKIIVVFSSHLGNEINNEFINHIHNTIGNVKHDVVCYENYNQYSLTYLYNKAISEYNQEDVIMVFCHPDIMFKTNNWGKIILNKFNNSNFSIIGVAGTTYLSENGIYWGDRSKMYGIVEHTDGINNWVNEYSKPIIGVKDVVTIDGLFMAIDCNDIECMFDETYNGFHFYDHSLCIKNYLLGVNVGVITDIRILHKSVGRTNNEWELNRQQFVNEYQDEFPIKYIDSNKLKVLICCQFFSTYTGSEVSNYELAKELVNLGCDVTLISSVVGNPLLNKAKKAGIKVFSLSKAPNFIIKDNNELVFNKNEYEFDIIHINHKPIGEMILKMYSNTPAIMHVRSEVIPTFEEPIIHDNIKKYISIRKSVTEYIKSFGINEYNIIEIDNPFDIDRFNTSNKFNMKIEK